MAARVLIVEDNRSHRKLFRDLLDAHGYETVQSETGFDGYELARTRKPDLILMDIRLPDVSGLEVIKWLKDDQDLEAIPIIAVTSLAMKQDEVVIRAAGCDGYLSKPISLPVFLETVSHMLNDSPRITVTVHLFDRNFYKLEIWAAVRLARTDIFSGLG